MNDLLCCHLEEDDTDCWSCRSSGVPSEESLNEARALLGAGLNVHELAHILEGQNSC
jgi:hypothetical protein